MNLFKVCLSVVAAGCLWRLGENLTDEVIVPGCYRIANKVLYAVNDIRKDTTVATGDGDGFDPYDKIDPDASPAEKQEAVMNA